MLTMSVRLVYERHTLLSATKKTTTYNFGQQQKLMTQ